MAIDLYDTSVANFLQVLESTGKILEKGESFAADNGLALADIVEARLREDMAPFRFQVVSVWHHSLGALKGVREGLFQPPPDLGDLDYAALKGLVDEALEALSKESRDDINALQGLEMLFKAGGFEVPFKAENFLLSFSLPNFYFHATTTYAILRMAGVPLGKMDYLGNMRMGG